MNGIYSLPWRPDRWALLLGVALAGAMLFFIDPAQHAIYPFCPLHRFTGLRCAGCGTLRALHQLGHGHLLEALRLNPLTVVALPLLLGWLIRELMTTPARQRFSTTNIPARWLWVIVGVLVGYTVLRNLPFAPSTWLAP